MISVEENEVRRPQRLPYRDALAQVLREGTRSMTRYHVLRGRGYTAYEMVRGELKDRWSDILHWIETPIEETVAALQGAGLYYVINSNDDHIGTSFSSTDRSAYHRLFWAGYTYEELFKVGYRGPKPTEKVLKSQRENVIYNELKLKTQGYL